MIILNKNQIPLLNSFINYISARSSTQILSIKDERTFLFSIFRVIGLFNSSPNSWFEIFLYLIPLPADLFRVARVAKVFDYKVSDSARVAELFHQIYKPLKQAYVDIHHILDF